MLLVKTRLGPSAIQGIGLFAAERVPRGAPVWRYLEGFDQTIPAALVERMSPAAKEQLFKYSYFHEETGEYELCADDARFFNHSEDPNTKSEIDENDDEQYVATRDIEPGTEITCDYREFDPHWREKLGS